MNLRRKRSIVEYLADVLGLDNQTFGSTFSPTKARMENYLVVSLILVRSFSLQRSCSAENALQFKLSSGEEISCVPIYEQPSLIMNSPDHAPDSYLKLRSEDQIQGASFHQQPSPNPLPKPPKFMPSDKSNEAQTQVIPDRTEIRLAEQLFKYEVGTCPEGMIPILRNQRPLRRTRVISRQGVDSSHGGFGRKITVTSTNTSEADPTDVNIDVQIHEYAADSAGPNDFTPKYRGGNGYFNVWKPYVELLSEFTSTQVWIRGIENSIEVGWQVYKPRYGDDFPHLFVRWTRDAYRSTGCYNLDCPGFVQISSSLVLGGSVSSFVSQTNGPQYELRVMVFLDQGTDAWWLNINGEFVGYWPNSLFTTLKAGAMSVEWGGEVSSQAGSRHTQTDMGSGEFAQAGFGKAAFIRSLQTVNQQNFLTDAPVAPSNMVCNNANCYSAQIFQDSSAGSTWRTYLYYGGPGYSPSCPK